MKPILILILLIAFMGCSSHSRQAARVVCNQVSNCCKSIAEGANKASVAGAESQKEEMTPNTVNGLSLIEQTEQILTW